MKDGGVYISLRLPRFIFQSHGLMSPTLGMPNEIEQPWSNA